MPEGIDLHDVLSGDAQAWANAGAAIIIGFITIFGWLRTKRVNSSMRTTVSALDIDKRYVRLESMLKQILDVVAGIARAMERGKHADELDRAYRRGLDEAAERRRRRSTRFPIVDDDDDAQAPDEET